MKTLAAVLLLAFSALVRAEPIAYATQDSVRVTLHSGPCTLTGVKNLPLRATWANGDARFEGCFGSFGPVLGFYFDDNTVAVVPLSAFRKLEAL